MNLPTRILATAAVAATSGLALAPDARARCEQLVQQWQTQVHQRQTIRATIQVEAHAQEGMQDQLRIQVQTQTQQFAGTQGNVGANRPSGLGGNDDGAEVLHGMQRQRSQVQSGRYAPNAE
jgi:hypothetical protein